MVGKKLVAVLTLILVLASAWVPGRAEADSDSITDGLIIGGITAGVVAAVLVVAILVTGDDEPEFLEMAPGSIAADDDARARAGIRLGCRQPDGTRPLACW